jgi:hypothetical protein
MTTPFSGSDLQLELLDPDAEQLVRLFRHPGGDWDPPDPKYRNQRVDPPARVSDRYAVLYTANSLPCVAAECRLLTPADDNGWIWQRAASAKYRVVRYRFASPAVFIPIDGPNTRPLDLGAPSKRFAREEVYDPTREIALQLHERFGQVAHGLSWASYHRHQLGRIYAIWHDRKDGMQLRREPPAPYVTLEEDAEWVEFLAGNPSIEVVS